MDPQARDAHAGLSRWLTGNRITGGHHRCRLVRPGTKAFMLAVHSPGTVVLAAARTGLRSERAALLQSRWH